MTVMADASFIYILYVRTLRRHCLLKPVIDEKVGRTRRRRRRKQLMDDFKPKGIFFSVRLNKTRR
jgi:hypothetical protein